MSQDHSRKVYRLGPRSAICNLFSTRFWATYLVELLLFITLENTISNKSGFKRPLPSTQIRITWLYFSWQLFPSCKSEGISCTSIFPTLRHNQGYRFYCLRHNEKIKHQVVRKKPFNEAHCKRNENNGQKLLKGKRRILVGKKKVCLRVLPAVPTSAGMKSRKHATPCLTFTSPWHLSCVFASVKASLQDFNKVSQSHCRSLFSPN